MVCCVVAPERARGTEYSRGESGIRGRSLFRAFAELSIPGGKVGFLRRRAGARVRKRCFPGGKPKSPEACFFASPRNRVSSGEYLHPRGPDFQRCRRIEFRRGKSGTRGGSLFCVLAEWSILGGILASAGGRFSVPPRKHLYSRVKSKTFGVRVFAFSRNQVSSRE